MSTDPASNLDEVLGVRLSTRPTDVPGVPVHEAAQLQDDLRRAGIEPFAWVINQSFAGGGITDPILRERGAREAPYLAEVRERHAARLAWLPWFPETPVGPDRLLQFAQGAAEPTDSPTFA